MPNLEWSRSRLRRPDDYLTLRDFRNMFAVLEDVAGFTESQYFDQLREALARHLGWTDSVVVDIPAEMAPFPAYPVASDHVYSNRPTAFVDEYVDRWRLRNPFKTAAAASAVRINGAVTLAELRPHSADAEWAFVDEYLNRHHIGDVLYGRIDAGSEGSALVCRYAADSSELDERERVLMKLLSRHLSPWLHGRFGGVRGMNGEALTNRERQVVQLVATGLSNRHIANELRIGLDTVKKHVALAMKKTGAENRTQLALIHLDRGRSRDEEA